MNIPSSNLIELNVKDSQEQIKRLPRRVFWPALIVLVSLGVFMAMEMRTSGNTPTFAAAYLPPAIAALAAAAFCWLRFRQDARAWWLGCAASFFLFFILTGQQILLESTGMISAFGSSGEHKLPWQPWTAARLALAMGILSAYTAPKGLLFQAGASTRQAIITVTVLSFLLCPLWTAYLPLNVTITAAHGLTAIDSLLLVAGGLVLVVTFARTRPLWETGEPFYRMLYYWLIGLGWSAACRVFPFVDVQTAVWVEMMVVGIVSMIACVHLVWTSVDSGTGLFSRYKAAIASRDVLAKTAAWPVERVADEFTNAVTQALNAERAMLLIKLPEEEEVIIASVQPTISTGKSAGDRLSLVPDRRNGFASGPASRCLNLKRIVVVTDVESDVEFIHWREFTEEPAYEVCIPVVHNSESIGVLLLWFPHVQWRPWECVLLGEEIVETCATVLAQLPSWYASIELTQGDEIVA